MSAVNTWPPQVAGVLGGTWAGGSRGRAGSAG